MDILKIKGGNPLQGSVKAAGAKNAVTKLLVASLLSDKRCVFFNVPNILDVEITVDLCREIGSTVHWNKAKASLKSSQRTHFYLYSTEIFRIQPHPDFNDWSAPGRTDEDIIVPTAGGMSKSARVRSISILLLWKNSELQLNSVR